MVRRFLVMVRRFLVMVRRFLVMVCRFLVMVRRFLVMVRRLTIFRNLVRHLWFGDQPSNVAFFGHGPSFEVIVRRLRSWSVVFGHGPSFDHIPKCEK